MRTSIRQPIYQQRRHYPTANRIARELTPALLILRTRTLVIDIKAKFDVSMATAMKAVSIARRAQ